MEDKMEEKEEVAKKTTSFFGDKSNFLGISILVSALIVCGTLIYIFGPGTSSPKTQTQTETQNTTQVGSIDISGAPTLGNANAPLTVIEFSDFSCPYCGMASGDNPDLLAYAKQNFGSSWEPIIPNLISNYVNTGKVKFVAKYAYGHSGGHPAQLVAWCLDEQGHFWDFYPLAFANQDNVENLDAMKSLAGTIGGVDSGALNSCLSSGKYDSRFDDELAEARSAGVSGTPTFLIGNDTNGYTQVVGAQPFSKFSSVLDAELAKVN